MENQNESQRHPTGRREFLRGAGLAACSAALGVAAPAPRVMAGSGDDGRGASRGLDGLDPKNLVDEVKTRNLMDRAQIDAAFRAVPRVCAPSMLEDHIEQDKFGWAHCLTLPQSACGLASLNTDRKLALGATFVWITAYRSILSRRPLDLDWTPEKVTGASIREALHTSPQVAAGRVWHACESEWPEIRVALATEASIRNDQHLVKTRATLDMGSFDPGVHTALPRRGSASVRALDRRVSARDPARSAPRRSAHPVRFISSKRGCSRWD